MIKNLDENKKRIILLISHHHLLNRKSSYTFAASEPLDIETIEKE